MVKEKLKTLFNEYREISNNLANVELREADLRYEKKDIKEVGNKADELNKQLDNKYNEIMEFIEEMV
nr:MAG TPA: hypothetical protein [Caudoviricetes sp.]